MGRPVGRTAHQRQKRSAGVPTGSAAGSGGHRQPGRRGVLGKRLEGPVIDRRGLEEPHDPPDPEVGVGAEELPSLSARRALDTPPRAQP